MQQVLKLSYKLIENNSNNNIQNFFINWQKKKKAFLFGITSTSLLFGELIDEDRDSDRMDSLGGDEEVVVVMYNDSEKNQCRHPRYHRQKSLHLRRLSSHPHRHRMDRPLLCPHVLFILFFPRKRGKYGGFRGCGILDFGV